MRDAIVLCATPHVSSGRNMTTSLAARLLRIRFSPDDDVVAKGGYVPSDPIANLITDEETLSAVLARALSPLDVGVCQGEFDNDKEYNSTMARLLLATRNPATQQPVKSIRKVMNTIDSGQFATDPTEKKPELEDVLVHQVCAFVEPGKAFSSEASATAEKAVRIAKGEDVTDEVEGGGDDEDEDEFVDAPAETAVGLDPSLQSAIGVSESQGVQRMLDVQRSSSHVLSMCLAPPRDETSENDIIIDLALWLGKRANENTTQQDIEWARKLARPGSQTGKKLRLLRQQLCDLGQEQVDERRKRRAGMAEDVRAADTFAIATGATKRVQPAELTNETCAKPPAGSKEEQEQLERIVVLAAGANRFSLADARRKLLQPSVRSSAVTLRDAWCASIQKKQKRADKYNDEMKRVVASIKEAIPGRDANPIAVDFFAKIIAVVKLNVQWQFENFVNTGLVQAAIGIAKRINEFIEGGGDVSDDQIKALQRAADNAEKTAEERGGDEGWIKWTVRGVLRAAKKVITKTATTTWDYIIKPALRFLVAMLSPIVREFLVSPNITQIILKVLERYKRKLCSRMSTNMVQYFREVAQEAGQDSFAKLGSESILSLFTTITMSPGEMADYRSNLNWADAWPLVRQAFYKSLENAFSFVPSPVQKLLDSMTPFVSTMVATTETIMTSIFGPAASAPGTSGFFSNIASGIRWAIETIMMTIVSFTAEDTLTAIRQLGMSAAVSDSMSSVFAIFDIQSCLTVRQQLLFGSQDGDLFEAEKKKREAELLKDFGDTAPSSEARREIRQKAIDHAKGIVEKRRLAAEKPLFIPGGGGDIAALQAGYREKASVDDTIKQRLATLEGNTTSLPFDQLELVVDEGV